MKVESSTFGDLPPNVKLALYEFIAFTMNQYAAAYHFKVEKAATTDRPLAGC